MDPTPRDENFAPQRLDAVRPSRVLKPEFCIPVTGDEGDVVLDCYGTKAKCAILKANGTTPLGQPNFSSHFLLERPDGSTFRTTRHGDGVHNSDFVRTLITSHIRLLGPEREAAHEAAVERRKADFARVISQQPKVFKVPSAAPPSPTPCHPSPDGALAPGATA